MTDNTNAMKHAWAAAGVVHLPASPVAVPRADIALAMDALALGKDGRYAYEVLSKHLSRVAPSVDEACAHTEHVRPDDGVCVECGEAAADARPVAGERAAYEAWAGVEYRHAEKFDLRDFAVGLAAWQARAALAAPQPTAHISADDRMELVGALGLLRGHRYTGCAEALQRVLDADAAHPQPSGNAGEFKTDDQLGGLLASIRNYGSWKYAEAKGRAEPGLSDVRAAWDEVYEKVQSLAAQPSGLLRAFHEACGQPNGRTKQHAASACPQWLPGATAPRDGTEFQAWAYDSWQTRCRFDPATGLFEIWSRGEYDQEGWADAPVKECRGWMPTPAAPKEQQP